MNSVKRGRVVTLTAKIEYPDGTSKTAIINGDGLDAIYFTELAMDDQLREMFGSNTDWTKNPTFLEKRGDDVERKCWVEQCMGPY